MVSYGNRIDARMQQALRLICRRRRARHEYILLRRSRRCLKIRSVASNSGRHVIHLGVFCLPAYSQAIHTQQPTQSHDKLTFLPSLAATFFSNFPPRSTARSLNFSALCFCRAELFFPFPFPSDFFSSCPWIAGTLALSLETPWTAAGSVVFPPDCRAASSASWALISEVVSSASYP